MLEALNINKNFGRKKVIDNLSISLEPGIYGLLGPNGAGKTTLMRCLCGIYKDKRNKILFEGRDIYADSSYFNTLGYLPQKFGLFKELKVKEGMEYIALMKGIPAGKIEDEIRRCLETVNLEDKFEDNAGSLSGGMTRRAGIAQALLGNPKVIVFDEPTAGLDPEERTRFKNAVFSLAEDKIVIISTHIVDDVAALCKKIII